MDDLLKKNVREFLTDEFIDMQMIRKKGKTYDVGVWIWLGLDVDVVWHGAVDCAIGDPGLGAYSLAQQQSEHAISHGDSNASERAVSGGDIAPALCAW